MPDRPPTRPAVIGRRTLLAGGLAAVLTGAACQRPIISLPRPSATPGPSVREWSARSPFFIGTRGGARDWPEMTEYAYEQAAAIPAIQAMEVSVCRSADGVLVCSADPDTARLTGRKLVIAKESWATLSQLRVSAAGTKDPSQPAQPLARLDEVLERFGDRFIFVVEPQTRESVTNLLAAMIGLGRPDQVVWKQPINSDRFAEARRHGFATWGYVLNEPAHTGQNLRQYAHSDDIDMIGISITHMPPLLANVLSAARQNQKPAIAWNIRGRTDLAKAVKLGFQGISTPSIREIVAMTI